MKEQRKFMTRNPRARGSKKPGRQAELRLRKQAEKLRQKIYEIEEARRKQENQQLVGRCYKYRNTYGSGSEKWWLYARILDLDGTGQPSAITFEKTSIGIYEIKTEKWFSVHEGYVSISGQEFCAEWLAFTKEINLIRVIP